MPQVDASRIKARAAQLREAVARQRGEWLTAQLGKELSVLAENDGTGHAENYAGVILPEGTPARSLIRLTPQGIVEGMLA